MAMKMGSTTSLVLAFVGGLVVAAGMMYAYINYYTSDGRGGGTRA